QASMRTSLLLIFVLCSGAAANDINWDECGLTARCRVHHACINPRSTFNPMLKEFNTESTKTCGIGIHIKPETTKKWIISIVNEDQKPPGKIDWTIGKNGKELFKCDKNGVKPGRDIPNVIVSEGRSISSSYAYWKFTVEANSHETLSKILDTIRTSHPDPMSFLSGADEYQFELEFNSVERKLPCDKDDLFMSTTACDETEHCEEVKIIINTYSCPTSYTLLLRKDTNRNFEKINNIACNGGTFYDNSGVKIESGAHAKCARKKCSLCETEKFEDYSCDVQEDDGCVYLECPEKKFMVINGDSKGDALTIRPSQTVQCSNKTTKKDSTVTSIWVVGNNDEVEISTVECKDSVKCEDIHPIDPTCDKTDKKCVEPTPDTSTGVYVCKPGHTMRVVQNASLGPINPPHCDENATWIITSNSSVSWRPEGNITINCFQDPVVEPLVTVEASSSWTWLIILVVVFLLLIIAIAIGVYFYLDRKKKKLKEAAGSVPTKTSTASKTSSKASSDEKEPLTSAMKSVTADSIQTAIEQKPTVGLTNTDLRPVTAAASDPPTDKKDEKKSETAPSKKEGNTSVKRKERDPSSNDDTSKNTHDVTSTKEKFAPMPKSAEDPLKSQTGCESQTEKAKNTRRSNEESAKLLPKKGPQRKYKTSKSSGASAAAKAMLNNDFLNLTYSDEEPSKTGSKKRGRKRH
ncbi:hypothetical protein PENTCL1PPCAC_24814, partial [Pristionchus entomophagus]